MPGVQWCCGRHRTSAVVQPVNAPSTGGVVVTLIARSAATRLGMFSSKPHRDGLPDPDDLAVAAADRVHRRVLKDWVWNATFSRGDTAQPERLGADGVALVVVQRVGGRPGDAVGAPAGRRPSGPASGDIDTARLHRWRLHRHQHWASATSTAVFDGCRVPNQQVAVACALSTITLTGGALATARALTPDQQRGQGAESPPSGHTAHETPESMSHPSKLYLAACGNAGRLAIV